MNAFSAIGATLLAICLSILANPVLAQGRALCREDGAQLELNACARDRYEAADRQLNDVYRQITQKLQANATALNKLRRAQRLWVQLRDADLEARFPVGDNENPRVIYGSMYPMLYASAKADMTRDRATWLRHQFLEHNEYDP